MVSRHAEHAAAGVKIGKRGHFVAQGAGQAVDHVAGDDHRVRGKGVCFSYHLGKPGLFLYRAYVQVAELHEGKTFKFRWKVWNGHVHLTDVGHAHGLPRAPCTAGKGKADEQGAAGAGREGQTPCGAEQSADAQHKARNVFGEREDKEHHECCVQCFCRQHDGSGQIGTKKAAADHLIKHVFERGGHECDAEKRFYGQSRLHGKDKAQEGVDRHEDGGKK